jgi:hypothetical protein
MRFGIFASIALSTLVGCGASVRAQGGDGSVVDTGVRFDGSRPDVIAPPFDAPQPVDVPVVPVDVVIPPFDVPIGADVPRPPDVIVPDVMINGDARGEWRLTTFRFNLMGAPAQLTDMNRSLPGDPVGRYRVNGTLDIRDDRLAFAWAVLRNDHALISDPTVDIDEGYSATAFFWNGRLDNMARRFTTGAIGLDFAFETPDILRLSSDREGWVALFRREPRTTYPVTMVTRIDGQGLQISAGTSDPFVRARAALLWDLPSTSVPFESISADLSFGGGGVQATYVLDVPGPAIAAGPIPTGAITIVNGVRVAWAHIVVYDDVDRSGRFNSSMAGGTGPDILRGVSPIGIGVRLDGTPDPMFDQTPFRLLKPGWQYVNVERNSDPRPAVLIPYAMNNPLRPDVPISETAVRRRILDLLP